MQIAIQMYSLRNQIKELGVEPVFKMVADAGFDSVEFAGFYGMSAVEMKDLLDKYNLNGVSAHIGLGEIANSLEYIDTIGIKSVYIPHISKEDLENKMPELVERIKEVKKLLDPRGVVLGYHNHDFEYFEGKDLVWDLLKAAGEGFYSEIDTFWVTVAGENAIEKMKQYGDKLKCLHIKELAAGENAKTIPSPIVGEGVVGFDKIFRLGKEMGIDLAVLEIENYPCEPFEYISKSCQSMKKLAGN